MPIEEPKIKASCDRCDEVSDEIDMTSLAGGGWDDRNVKARLKRWGWYVYGEQTVCPDCMEAEASEVPNGHSQSHSSGVKNGD